MGLRILVVALITCFLSSAFASQIDGTRFIKAGTITTSDLGTSAVTAAKMGSGAAPAGQVPISDGLGAVAYGAVTGTSWSHTTPTLIAGDITNQYIDFPVQCVGGSVDVAITGVLGQLTTDYTLSIVASKTRVSFVAATGFGTGSSQALVAGDVLDLKCAF